jgi:hypothetical protein
MMTFPPNRRLTFNGLHIVIRSRGSIVSIATGYGLDGGGVGVTSPGRAKNFIVSKSNRPALGPTQPIQWVPETLPLGVKLPGREVDHSPPASAEFKKMWSHTSNSPICLHGVVLNSLSTVTTSSFPFTRRYFPDDRGLHDNMSFSTD